MSEEDKSQKTEDATQQKLKKSREEGKTFSSREINNLFSFITAAIVIKWIIPNLSLVIYDDLLNLYTNSILIDKNLILTLIRSIFVKFITFLVIIIIPFTLSGIISSIIQHGFIYSPKNISPKLDRISLINGAKRIFSINTLVEMLKGIIKIIIVGIALYRTILPEINNIFISKNLLSQEILDIILICIGKMLSTVIIVMFFLSILDYLYQRYKYYTDMKMSKQEIKDEHKQNEGDPKIKSKLRQIARKRLRNNMKKAIKEATVLITNPTHYAVAIKYDDKTMSIPIVTAKGVDEIALEMKKIARDNFIPIIENKTLAQSLYANIKVDHEITQIYYQAVANIINYIYNLNNR
ncbi:flagellar biosynthesis protein FlhB [Lyticum sinuosum]|uniref:Flagellar biosynthetic protein FlhB n=1 Tax=Lyticum sinuosum TaxID=1332059 RepID=A0AAE4VKD1_9RICK|nr:flagellar biosynthesis protein FlhB [Lyticum sinuosum]MDZ5761590.1 Flagellar biosynthetic protein FlhB [Lyticum sinuosum]